MRTRAWPLFSAITAAIAAALVAVALVETLRHGVTQLGLSAGFAGIVALGETAQFRYQGNRTNAPVAVTAGLGFAMLHAPGVDPRPSPWQPVLVMALGVGVGVVVRAAAGLWFSPTGSSRRVLAISVAALVVGYMPGAQIGFAGGRQAALETLARMVAGALACFLTDAIISAGRTTERDHRRYRHSLRDEFGLPGRLAAGTMSCGILLAVAVSLLRWWGLVLVLVALAYVQFALRRWAQAQRTYADTMTSLSRTTELAGFQRPGANRRATRLALAIGDQLGLSETRMLALEYATLLEGVGELTLEDRHPATSLVALPEERAEAARAGADVIERTGVLDDVAEIIRYSHDPYRGRDHDAVPREAGIVRVALDCEQAMGGSARPAEASASPVPQSIALGIGNQYDPEAVDALRRVLDRGFEF